MKQLLVALLLLPATLLWAQDYESVGHPPIDNYVSACYSIDAKINSLASQTQSLDAEMKAFEARYKKADSTAIENIDEGYDQARTFGPRADAIGEGYEELRKESAELGRISHDMIVECKNIPNKLKIPKAQKYVRGATKTLKENRSRIDEDMKAYGEMRTRATKLSAIAIDGLAD